MLYFFRVGVGGGWVVLENSCLEATNGFHAKWLLRKERRNSILKMCHYPYLGSASDWMTICFNRSEALLTRHWHRLFLKWFLRHHFAERLMASRNDGGFSQAMEGGGVNNVRETICRLPWITCHNNDRSLVFFNIPSRSWDVFIGSYFCWLCIYVFPIVYTLIVVGCLSNTLRLQGGAYLKLGINSIISAIR